jgi:hypothetical protein
MTLDMSNLNPTSSSATRTLGIDLASQPRDTAACEIEWASAGSGRVIHISDRLTDSALLEMLEGRVTKVGIDAPFGWPLEFIDALTDYRDRGEWPVPPDDPKQLQPGLVLRETDREVLRATGIPRRGDTAPRKGKQPMSVTTSWLAFPAMRCARLLAEVGQRAGEPVDRSGAGRFVEVYPDAALRQWDLSPAAWTEDPGSYKGPEPTALERRRRLVDALLEATAGWLEIESGLVSFCKRDDDALDALVCALVARAAELGATDPPPVNSRVASQEGWIHLPRRGPLSALGSGP